MKPQLGQVRYRKEDDTPGSRQYAVEVFYREKWNFLGRCVDRRHAQFIRRTYQMAIDAIIAEATA